MASSTLITPLLRSRQRNPHCSSPPTPCTRGLPRGAVAFGMSWGSELPMVLVVLFAWAALTASLGVLLGSLARTEGQAVGLGVLTAVFFLTASVTSAPLGKAVERIGWQRAMRRAASQVPLNAPCLSRASSA